MQRVFNQGYSMSNFPAHGGNVYEVASRLLCLPEDILDYSASINPLGPPDGLREAFLDHFERLQHYPDIHNHDLIQDLAAFHGVPTDHIVVGNGSTELIYWLPRVLGIRTAVAVLPTFSEYQRAFEIQGVQLTKLVTRPENDLQPTVEELATVLLESTPEAILVTHPGSPAGTLLPPAVREWLLCACNDRGIYCIVDEAFVDFCEEDSFKRFLAEMPRLILIRSMTKFYGIPGVRLGYLLTSRAIAGNMLRFLPPWSVSTLAQIAGSYCLRQDDYRRHTLDLVTQERAIMQQTLCSLPGFHVFSGRANYLLVRMDAQFPTAGELQEDLLQSERILVRDCVSFEGLGDRYVRLAVRRPQQNGRVLTAIARWNRDHGRAAGSCS
jgi:threonine-phosphate decarboxylase